METSDWAINVSTVIQLRWAGQVVFPNRRADSGGLVDEHAIGAG
jgi:hypothetical protein